MFPPRPVRPVGVPSEYLVMADADCTQSFSAILECASSLVYRMISVAPEEDRDGRVGRDLSLSHTRIIVISCRHCGRHVEGGVVVVDDEKSSRQYLQFLKKLFCSIICSPHV